MINAYQSFIITTIELFKPENRNLKKEAENIFNIEQELGMSQVDEATRRTSEYTNMTLDELQEKLPQFEWKKYIHSLFRDIKNVTITNTEEILVDDLPYLERAVQIYADYNGRRKRDMDNYLIWSYYKDKFQYLPKRFREIKNELDKVTKGVNTTPPRSFLCSNYVLVSMEYAVGRMYVEKYFDEDSKNAATEMILNIKLEMNKILKEIDWMDEDSKLNVLKKAEYIDTKIGYDENIKNDSYINDLYKDFSFSELNFFENSLNIAKVNVIDDLKYLRITRDRQVWFSGPAVVNAFYSPPANQICFPAGILQTPFYSASNPNYLNYGGIGSVIGHEITHGFDDRGRLYDKDGKFHSSGFWSNDTTKNFKEKAKCIVDQYNNYTSAQINQTLNGLMTLGENIADNGGLKQSYRAYQRWTKQHGPEKLLPGLKYNQNQLFFINYGQIWCGKYRNQNLITRILTGHHSPGEFRVIGPTSNLNEFSKAFSCKLGRKNNPIKKCSVW